MPRPTLYYKPTCPFCIKVLRFMETNKINLELKDVAASSQNREGLQTIGGKTQVPCLVIEGKAMYESDTIINWLDEHKSELN